MDKPNNTTGEHSGGSHCSHDFFDDIGKRIKEGNRLASTMSTDQARLVDNALERVRTGKSGYYEEIAGLVIALTEAETSNAKMREEHERALIALEGVADMPGYDQDDAHRLRNIARVFLANVQGHGLSPVAKTSTSNPACHG
jgi:hypothetical protein